MQRTGEVVTTTVSLVDLAPTILNVVGLQAGGVMHGSSLPRGQANSSRKIFSEGFAKHDAPKRLRRDQTAVFTGTLKFILSTNGHRELYDLATDPRETRNLFSRNSAAAVEMEKVVLQWIKEAPAGWRQGAKPDAATLERLRSLGYVQ